jgi:hypothetical protein
MAPSAAGRPSRATSSRISGMPLATCPWPLALPMSWSSMPSMSSSGFSTSWNTSAAPSDSADWPGASASRCSTASSECWSAEKRW